MVWYQWSFYACHSGRPIKFFHNAQYNYFTYKFFGFCWWRCRTDFSEYQPFFPFWPTHLSSENYTSPNPCNSSEAIVMYIPLLGHRGRFWPRQDHWPHSGIDITYERSSPSSRTMNSSERASLECWWFYFLPHGVFPETEVNSEGSRVKRWSEREASCNDI